ncbi:hypothetical protein [Pseudomonas serbica]|jgi:hypothetical protein|uniref:hypothetical protein n=1 Tax=Pseudomonas serbica TaxID=2965074 RepID=UPI00237B48AD|nr:hypothetical protein [Pseudomonas serbica]
MGVYNPLARLLPENYRTPEVEAKHTALFRTQCLDIFTEKPEQQAIWPVIEEVTAPEPTLEQELMVFTKWLVN